MTKIDLNQVKNLVVKVLLKGTSGTGKTHYLTRIAKDYDGDVLFVDTEEEALLMFQTFEEDLSHIDYFQVENFKVFEELIGRQRDYDLVCVDTLDDKNTFSIEDATRDGEASPEWNQYANIYAKEKRLMRQIRKPDANMLCAVDPESGKKDKPKDVAVNVDGRFTTVLELRDNGGFVVNDVVQGEFRGKVIGNVKDAVEKRFRGEMWGE